MKNQLRRLILSFYILFLLGNISLASAATNNEIETIFNWAESNFSQFFPNHQTTRMTDPWAFRFYPAGPSGGVYVGIKQNEVFVFGGPWGTAAPTFIDTVQNLTAQIVASGGSGSVPGCAPFDVPNGMVFSRSGNVYNFTTNGQCIEISEDQGYCEPPVQSVATNMSVLSITNITAFEAKGIAINMPPPGIPNLVEETAASLSNTVCTINAPIEEQSKVVNVNICRDDSRFFSGFSQGQGGITVSPPVTFAYAGTSTNRVVSDCFVTGAEFIDDVFTGESWERNEDGDGFIRIN